MRKLSLELYDVMTIQHQQVSSKVDLHIFFKLVLKL